MPAADYFDPAAWGLDHAGVREKFEVITAQRLGTGVLGEVQERLSGNLDSVTARDLFGLISVVPGQSSGMPGGS